MTRKNFKVGDLVVVIGGFVGTVTAIDGAHFRVQVEDVNMGYGRDFVFADAHEYHHWLTQGGKKK